MNESRPMLLRSRLLGSVPNVLQGFTTRVGGVSEPPYDSLNLALGGGDLPDRVKENWRRLLAEMGCPGAEVWRLYQTHSDQVSRVPVTEGSKIGVDGLCWAGDGDGLVTGVPGKVLVAFTADCTPLLLTAGNPARAVGAVHAGWRGVANEVALRTLERLLEAGQTPVAEVRVAIGPAIGVCCFEVGEEVARIFQDRFGPEVVVRRPEWEKPHVDLARALRYQLAGRGVGADRIEGTELCTRCRGDLFYSHRRDGTRRGGQAGVIAMV